MTQTFRVDAYDSRGRLRETEAPWSLFAAFAPSPADGEALVRLGVSTFVVRSAAGLRAACPYPLEIVLHVRTGDRSTAGRMQHDIERDLADLAAPRLPGWLRFDLTSPMHKRRFQAACREAHAAHVGSGELEWTTIAREQVEAYDHVARALGG